MSEYLDPSQIQRLEIKRDKELIIRFTRLEDIDMWEVGFFSEDNCPTVCPRFGISISCNNCVFDDDEGCSAPILRINTKEVIALCFGLKIWLSSWTPTEKEEYNMTKFECKIPDLDKLIKEELCGSCQKEKCESLCDDALLLKER